MEYRFERVTENVYALAVWDEAARSYNNCYILLWDGEVIVIDAGKSEHSSMLLWALSCLNKERHDVTAIIATHGHLNHIGGSSAFPSAAKLIHTYDWSRMPHNYQLHFTPTLPGEGSVLDIDCLLLEHHTPGSVALFHRPTKCLFVGDHICFPGSSVEPGELTGVHMDLRLKACKYARRISGPVYRLKENAKLFRTGLGAMTRFEAQFLCTGHGGVLQGEINPFLTELMSIVGEG